MQGKGGEARLPWAGPLGAGQKLTGHCQTKAHNRLHFVSHTHVHTQECATKQTQAPVHTHRSHTPQNIQQPQHMQGPVPLYPSSSLNPATCTLLSIFSPARACTRVHAHTHTHSIPESPHWNLTSGPTQHIWSPPASRSPARILSLTLFECQSGNHNSPGQERKH